MAHHTPRLLAPAILIGAILSPAMAFTQDSEWRQFRGPGARGVVERPGLPLQWSSDSNVRWKTDIPGRGWSSPIVSKGRIFLTTVVNDGETEAAKKGLYFGGNRLKPPTTEHHWTLLCLDAASGELLWEREFHRGTPQSPRHIKNSYASETPVTDGERVYALFGDVGIFCCDLDGEVVWSDRWEARATRYGWGPAASPALHGDRLYIVDDNDDESRLTCRDKRTGEVVWQVERAEKSNWATPFIWENSVRTEIVTPGTGKTRSYDLEGNLLYELGGASSITIATPYTAHGLLYVSSGYVLDPKKPVFAIKPGAVGDISLGEDETESEFVAWCQKQAAPYNPTSLVYGDLLYVLLDRGFLTCHDAKTGQPVYDKRRIPKGRAFTASPWAANGHIFALNEDGVTFVFRAGREFELLHTNRLADDDMCMATPAVSGNSWIIRTSERVYAIGNR